MSMDQEDQRWFEAMKAKGHMPIMASYSTPETPYLDMFVQNAGYHNGPGCQLCHWTCCMHCEGVDSIPECDVIEGEVISKPLEIEGPK